MAVVNAVFRQELPGGGESIELAPHHGIGGVPVERKLRRLDGVHGPRGLASGGGVAGKLILQQQQNALLAGDLGGGTQLLIDGRAIGRNIVQPPEVEAADLLRC